MMKGYWILFEVCYCPACGWYDTFQTRIFDRPKPTNPNERYIWKEVRDYTPKPEQPR